MADVDPQALIDRLTAVGFTLAGRSRGGMRFGYPRQAWPHGSLLVPTDPTAPEFPQMMTAVLRELENAAMRGDAARKVLEGLAT